MTISGYSKVSEIGIGEGGSDTDRIGCYLPQSSVVRRTNDSHDVQQLVLIISSTKQRNTGYHLGKYTATGPYIDGCTVCARTEEYVGGSIP
jgi:hypothetical protein